jgi:hypothetical protein
MTKSIGLHYFNVFEQISDIRHILDETTDIITHKDQPIQTMFNNPDYQFLMLKNDHAFMTSFVLTHGSETENQRLLEICNASNFIILDAVATSNFIFGICNYCEENTLDCLIDRKQLHAYTVRLSGHCKDYMHRYNIPMRNYNKIIFDTNTSLYQIMKEKLGVPQNTMNVFDNLISSVIKGKEILLLKETANRIEEYVYLHGDVNDIARMNAYFDAITIISNKDKYISDNIVDQEINMLEISKHYPKYTYENAMSKVNNKDSSFYKSLTISNSLNIPYIISEDRYFNFMFQALKKTRTLVLIHNKINLTLFK